MALFLIFHGFANVKLHCFLHQVYLVHTAELTMSDRPTNSLDILILPVCLKLFKLYLFTQLFNVYGNNI